MMVSQQDCACLAKGAKIGDVSEQVPAYYQQWADKIDTLVKTVL